MEFENKVAVVAGAGKGMGGATAKLLASQGTSVVVVDINQSAVDETVSEIAASGGQATAVIADASKSDQVRNIPQVALETYGGIDYLVNAIGVQTYGNVVETDEALWDKTIDANLKAFYLMAHYCVPAIIKRGGGAIVHIASVQGHNSSQERVVAYATTKAGVVALSRSMSLDHAKDNIRVNCILPGSIDTPLLRGAAANYAEEGNIQAVVDSWGKSHPLGRVGQPEEIAQLVAYLLSDKASFITGATITADGGLTTKLL